MAEYQPSFETLVRLAVERGVLLASLLQRYQLRYHLNDAHFSEQLHCTMDNLIHLKLCDLPRSDHFQEDIERIAEHTHGDVVALTRILNEQTHLERFHQFLKERGFTINVDLRKSRLNENDSAIGLSVRNWFEYLCYKWVLFFMINLEWYRPLGHFSHGIHNEI